MMDSVLRRAIPFAIGATALAMLTSCAEGERPLPELAAAAGRDVPGPARYAPVACWFELQARREVACGALTVPENWEDASSASVHLPVVVFRSKARGASREPIVMLSGGPGGRARLRTPQQLQGWLDLLRTGDWAHDRDVIVLAQRGTNWTDSDLSCPSLESEQAALLDQAVRNERLADCGRRLAVGHDLAGYTSAQSARDVTALAQSMGLGAWSLYGVSYGTRFALTIMRLHPAGLRAVILDSVLPHSVNHLTPRSPTALKEPLQGAFASCRRDPLCREHFPDPEGLYRSALRRLENGPIAMGPRGATVVDQPGLLDGLSEKLAASEPGAIPGLLEAVAAYSEDDFWRAVDLSGSQARDARPLAIGAFMSIGCNDGVKAARIAAQRDRSGVLGSGSSQACQNWPTVPSEAGDSDPVVSEVPTLLLAGEIDPLTPPENAHIAAATLAHAHVFVLPMVGHGALRTAPCAATIVAAFLEQPERRPEVACPPPAFDVTPSLLIRSAHLLLEGKLPEAKTVLEQILAVQETREPASLEVAATLALLGGVYYEQHDLAGAAAALERTLAIVAKAHGLSSVEAGQAAGLLADVYYDQGRRDEARILYQRALRAFAHASGQAHRNAGRYERRLRQLQARSSG